MSSLQLILGEELGGDVTGNEDLGREKRKSRLIVTDFVAGGNPDWAKTAIYVARTAGTDIRVSTTTPGLVV